jgi:hypothetical protein
MLRIRVRSLNSEFRIPQSAFPSLPTPNSELPDRFVEFLGFVEDGRPIVFVNTRQDVGGGHDRSDTIPVTDPTHLDGLLKALGAIIQPGKDMGMEVDHLNHFSRPFP